MPGIYSARFAGEPTNDASNNAKLLHELTACQKKKTSAFPLYIGFAEPKKESLVVEAEWPGEVGTIPRGEGGFGYDSLFYVPELGKTAAELSGEEKIK